MNITCYQLHAHTKIELNGIKLSGVQFERYVYRLKILYV